MTGYINGVDWVNCDAMRYWSFPKTYKGDPKTETREFIMSGNYLGARKMDGYYQRVVKDEDGNCFMLARNKNVKGEMTNKIEWVPHLNPFFESLPNGTVLIVECYLPGNEGSKKVTSLLGCLKEKCIARQEAGQKLHLYIFDMPVYGGESFVTEGAAKRFERLRYNKLDFINEYVEVAQYYTGEELWNELAEIFEEGGEGIVIVRNDCPYYFKRTPARMSIKVKKEIKNTIDVIVMGGVAPTKEYNGKSIETWKYWHNLYTDELSEENHYKEYMDGEPWEPVTKNWFYGWAGSVQVGAVKDNKVVCIGRISGLTEEILANVDEYKGKVMEITCMEVFEDTQGLRHPKFVQWRPDLTARDCEWSKIFG